MMPGPPPVHARERAGLRVVVRVLHGALCARDALGVAAGLCVGQLLPGVLGCHEARAAVHHDGVLDALRRLAQVGLEQLQLEADAACLAAQHEFGVGEGQAVGVGVQRVAGDGEVVQLGPGVGQAAFSEVGIGVHWENSSEIGR
jgi:hypothetical protein